MNSQDIQAVLKQVDSKSLQQLVDKVVGERHPRNSPDRHREVREYIEATWRDQGYSISHHHFTWDGLEGISVIADWPGSADLPPVLITAHYDSVVGSPGADDNGSAVASMMECGRLLAGLDLRRPVRLVAFDMEECQGDGESLVGSHHYAQDLKQQGVALAGVLNLEMVGYTDDQPGAQTFPPGLEMLAPKLVKQIAARDNRGDFLAVVGDGQSLELTNAVAAAAEAEVAGFPVFTLTAPPQLAEMPDLLRSDHSSFWRAGYPALMLTDTSNFRNPHYHEASDTVDTLDWEYMASVTRVVLATVLRMDGE